VKVLIAGGGTGGHIYIGVALAREILRRDSRAECVFAGTRRGLESRLVPEEGFRLELIDSAGLKRVSARALARGLLLLPLSLAQSLRLVRRFTPDAAVGVGGFSSGPVIAAAWVRGVPTLVVEPNAYPGLANRWLARIVDAAAVALPEALAHFRGKGVVTGIPVRREFQDLKRREHRAGLDLLVYGGSQGSHALNAALCSALPELASLGPELRIVHQTGEKEWEMVEQAYRGAGVKAEVRPYLPRIYEELAEADLVLARAGASTVAELTVAGRAALLVPFPSAADDHQTRNAAALQRAGAARMIPERELGAARLLRELRFFLDHPEELRQMEEAARRLALPDAAARIADLVLELARRKRK
jgi:UDP-N-acetylglucosamine--N-acetylmuramyl-(pentapeptide) pyrophosphoryl-undecaprenol N-acetylglucosamine transferase